MLYRMQKKGSGYALLCHEGRLSGILTERDLLCKAAGKAENLSALRVSQYMTRDPEVIRGDQLLASALQRMMVGDLRHLRLVDTEGILEPNEAST